MWYEARILRHYYAGNKLEQKNSHRKTSRHPSFRENRRFVWPRLPLVVLLAIIALYVTVLSYERWQGKGNVPATRLASARQSNNALTGKASQDLSRMDEIQAKTLDPHRSAARPNPAFPLASASPPLEKPSEILQYTMQKNGFGNIVGIGSINGKSVNFLADTGASTVVVPEKIAQRIGLNKGLQVPFTTAGGIVVHYATILNSLRLGQIEIHNVPAAINPAMKDDTVLLGMTALGLMDMHMEQGNLILKYKASNSDDVEQRQSATDEPFKRSYKECAEQGNKFDQKALDCLRGK